MLHLSQLWDDLDLFHLSIHCFLHALTNESLASSSRKNESYRLALKSPAIRSKKAVYCKNSGQERKRFLRAFKGKLS